MSYNVIRPPLGSDIFEMSREDLKSYYKWFFDIMETRFSELAVAVTESQGFSDWRPTLSPDSFEMLGMWFARQVETRPRSLQEFQYLRGQSKFPIKLPDWELTDKTLSLAFDIGMYFGQSLKHNYPHLQWEQALKDKRFVDYGRPVLTGFGKVALNPIRLTTVLAYGLVDKSRTGKDLRETYAIWEKLISPR